MNKIKRLLSVLIIIGSFAPSGLLAAPKNPPSCEDVEAACNAAVDQLTRDIDVKNLVISDLTSQNLHLTEQYNDIKQSESAWYHNPFILTALGFAFGVMGGVYAAKH